MSSPVLTFDYDAARWSLGPNEDFPFDRWLPLAVAEIMDRFSVPARNTELRDGIELTLAKIGRFEDALPYVLMYWPDLGTTVLPIFVGMVPREDPAEIDSWLRGDDLTMVEPAGVEEIPVEREGVSMRRLLASTTDAGGQSLLSARYVIDTGHPDFVALARVSTYDAADVVDIQAELTATLGTATIGPRSAQTPNTTAQKSKSWFTRWRR